MGGEIAHNFTRVAMYMADDVTRPNSGVQGEPRSETQEIQCRREVNAVAMYVADEAIYVRVQAEMVYGKDKQVFQAATRNHVRWRNHPR
jgi:hypothetical protein